MEYVVMFWFMASLIVFGLLEIARDIVMSNTRKVGGIWFTRLGRVQISFCLCAERKAIK